jgi:hypothetical protein
MEMCATEKRNGFSATEPRLACSDVATAIRGGTSEYKKSRGKRFGIFFANEFLIMAGYDSE